MVKHIKKLTYNYYHKHKAKKVHLVLHGGGTEGIESQFISQIIHSLKGRDYSVFGFNFPFCERREEESSGIGLEEEIDALRDVIAFLRDEGYSEITIIAKSLGGVVASYYFDDATQDVEGISVIVLGYVLGSVKTTALGNLLSLVIQGEFDRFGNAETIKTELKKNKVNSKIVEIPKADHSYRNKKGQPVYQKEAIEQLLRNLGH